MKTTQENIFSSKTLTYFLQLSETMNYTQAAQILGITQPALTQQIKKLEHTVGTNLFYSVGKKLKLSDAGYIMLKATHQIYDILNQATDEIQQATSSTNGEINLGILASIETKVFEQFALKLYKENPDLVINFHMLTRKEIWESLENNKIDLAIMYLPDESIKNWKPYSSQRIISDDLWLIHHNKKNAGKKKIKLKDANDRGWVVYPAEYYLSIAIKEIFKNNMVDAPKVQARFTMPEQILNFAVHAELNTALPKSYLLNVDLDKLKDLGLYTAELEPNVDFDLEFVYRKNKNEIPRIGRFLDKFNAYLEEKDYISRLTEKE